MPGTVEHVHVAPSSGAEPTAVESVEAVAGAGLRGDRYFDAAGTFADREGCDLTLVEAEAVAAVREDHGLALAPGAHRRNVTTRGVALNHLVDERFRVGGAVCVGTELCEPCAYLERHVGEEGLRDALVHRGGLRCRIVEGGQIEVGDPVERVPSGEETDG